jgi:hypothetical protein
VRGAGAILGVAVALSLSSCVSDPYGDPFPGHDVRVILKEEGSASARWPAAWARGARFVVENRTGLPVETILLDLGGPGAPRELLEAVVEDPAGVPATILPSPRGTFPLRARIGDPGAVILEPGAALVLRVRVAGTPGKAVARFDVPR